MNDPSSRPDADDELMAQFLGELEQRGSAIIDEYKRRHPHLAGPIDEAVRMQDALGDARHDGGPSVPARLGEFRIVRPMPGGGMGELYEAEQERLGRRVVVKIIRRGRISLRARDYFLREQEVLAKLHQTHIVPIYAAGEEGRLQYYAMPYIDGAALDNVVKAAWTANTAQPGSKTPTLAELAERLAARGRKEAAGHESSGPDPNQNGSTQPEEPTQAGTGSIRVVLSPEYFRSVAEVLASAAEAVQHAHDAGILHRDLKPSNIMVDRHGQCWVIDFGLAGYLRGHRPPGTAEEGTEPGPEAAPISGVMGTPNYMAPEQFDGKPEVCSDVWALGATLYELLTLRRAFDGETLDEIRRKVTEKEPALLETLSGDVPADLAAVCRKAMRKEPQARYATAQEFADDLRRWLRQEPTKARGAWVGRRVRLWARRNPGWAAACVLAVVASVVATWAAAVFRERNQEAERQSLIRQAEGIRLKPRGGGWRDDAWELQRKAAKIRTDDLLRDQTAATLMGIDARRMKYIEKAASSVIFHPDDGRLLAGGWQDEPARLWNEKTDEVTASQQAGAEAVAFRGNTPLQVVIGKNDTSTLLLWDMDKKQFVGKFTLPFKERSRLRTAALSADGAFLAAIAEEGDKKEVTKLTVWDARTERVVRTLDRHGTVLAFAPDGSLLASGGEDGIVSVYELSRDGAEGKGEPTAILRAGRSPIRSLAFGRLPRPRDAADRKANPGYGWLLAVGDARTAITIWDVEAGSPRAFCRGSHHDVPALAFGPDGTLLASGDRGGANVWDVTTGRLLLRLPSSGMPTGIAFSADGKRVAVSARPIFNEPGTVQVWELEHGRGILSLRGLTGQVARVAWSPGGEWLAAVGHDWQVAVWDVHDGRLRYLFDAPPEGTADSSSIAFRPDGGQLAFAGQQTAILWDMKSGKEVRPRWNMSRGFVNKLAFDGAGRLLLLREETKDGEWGDAARHPRVCRLRNLLGDDPLTPIQEINDFDYSVLTASLAADGSYFVVEGRGGREGQSRWIKTFESATGKELWSKPLKKHLRSEYAGVTIDPTGKFLAYQEDDSTATVLVEAPSGKRLRAVPFAILGLSPGLRYFAGQGFVGPSEDVGTVELRGRNGAPLVMLGIDQSASSLDVGFDCAGTRLAWGSADGTVTVCDVPVVQRQLAAVGLGWE